MVAHTDASTHETATTQVIAASRYINCHGLTLHLREWQPACATTKPPLLLVHGLASNSRLWDGAAVELTTLGYKVLAIDQRGHGLSEKPDDGYDMATVVADLASVIETLQLERPVVAGQSWGGNVVVELGLRRPDLLRGICAVDGGLIQLADRFTDWHSCAALLAPPPLVGMPATQFEAMIRNAYHGWPETAIQGTLSNMEVLSDGTIRPHLTRDRHMKVLRGLWQHRPVDNIKALTRPVLFTPASPAADRSRDQHRDYDTVATFDHVRVEWFSPAHHDLHAQHPERWANVVHHHIENGFLA